jgi:hypothetical protein
MLSICVEKDSLLTIVYIPFNVNYFIFHGNEFIKDPEDPRNNCLFKDFSNSIFILKCGYRHTAFTAAVELAMTLIHGQKTKSGNKIQETLIYST